VTQVFSQAEYPSSH